jgi:hypothetical protein
MNLDAFFIKRNSKMDHKSNCKLKNIKLLKDNIEDLYDLECDDDFLDTAREQSLKETTDQLDLIKIFKNLPYEIHYQEKKKRETKKEKKILAKDV